MHVGDDSYRLLHQIDDAGGGKYAVHMKELFTQITWNLVENVVTETFGSHAARLFRFVKNYPLLVLCSKWVIYVLDKNIKAVW